MARPTKAQKKKIKKLEQEIKEEESLWEKIKAIPKDDKLSLKQLKSLVKKHKVTKRPKVSKAVKQKANNLFGGLEPPEKQSKKSKR